jgi:class 3 adenylate cyclase
MPIWPVAGLPLPSPDHAEAAIRLAAALLEAAKTGAAARLDLSIRIGIATGPVLAG